MRCAAAVRLRPAPPALSMCERGRRALVTLVDERSVVPILVLDYAQALRSAYDVG